METFELIEKLFELENKFSNDPEVKEMKKKLIEKFKTLEKEVFTEEELESSEMEEANDEYYSNMRCDMKPDDYDLFQVVYFS